MSQRSADTGPMIVYDGDCPFCAAYVRMTRLTAAAGPARLVDARDGGPEVAALMSRGIDLDAGMAVVIDGEVHHGDRAMTVLAMLTTPSGLFNRLMRRLFRHPGIARRIYPVLAAGRRLVLRVLRRPPLRASS